MAASSLLAAGCPGDDSSSNDTGAASSTGDTPMGSTGTGMASSGGADTTAGPADTTGEPEPLPEFDCAGATTVHDGHILIESEADLAMLDGISEVTRSVVINGTTITNLDALGCVTSIGEDLQIFGNDQLTNVDGLVNLTSLGGSFIFSENDGLTDFDGLQQLAQISGSLSMNKNQGMTQISGFDSLIGIEGDVTIRDNDVLTNIDGLIGLRVVGGLLAITNNPMLCISSVNAVGDGIEIPSMPFPPEWSTSANDNDC